jgi:hypothetical protein
MRIPAVNQLSFLYSNLAQASEQELHPMQRSMYGVVNIFISPQFGPSIVCMLSHFLVGIDQPAG